MSYLAQEAIEQEIKQYFKTVSDIEIKLPRGFKINGKRLPIWHSSDGSLRFNDLGFDLYCLVHPPSRLDFKISMSSQRMLEMVRVMRMRPWHYYRKYSHYTQGMTHTINCWDPSVEVSWKLCGGEWDSWISLCS